MYATADESIITINILLLSTCKFWGAQETKTYNLENDDLENNDLENDDLDNDDLENDDLDDLENDDLENDDKDGVARRIKGLEEYRRREIRGRQEGIMKG